MKRTIKILLLLSGLAVPQWRCVEKYNSPYVSPRIGYLVVEGYISGNSPTQFALSRTIPLPGDTAVPPETGAKLQVEGTDNSVYPLTEQSAGVYGVNAAGLSSATQYRLRITTAAGEQYLSSYVPYKQTPPIDSVNWVNKSTGVQIYVNTHDPANATRYYQWEYGETWEYNSAEQSGYIYDTATGRVVTRPPADQIYTCWHSDSSSNVLIGNSVNLGQDVIYLQPLTLIPTNGQQLSRLYSILVRQYALTEDGYNFLSLMQSNTESLGSIFDVQPSQLTGNIQCLTNPSEPVVGYVSAGTVQEQRIFISPTQVPGWYYSYKCQIPDSLVSTGPDALQYFFDGYGFIPLYPQIMASGTGIAGWWANFAFCVDCRLEGGSTQEPAFWPN